jgi:hypothetical protein
MKRMRVVAGPLDTPSTGEPSGSPAPTEEDLQRMLEEGGGYTPAPSDIAVMWDAYLTGGGDPYGEFKVADISSGKLYNISLSPDGQGVHVAPVELIARPDWGGATLVPHGEDGQPDWGYISTKFFPSGPVEANLHAPEENAI